MDRIRKRPRRSAHRVAAAGVCWWLACLALACQSPGERQASELSQQKPAPHAGAAPTTLPPANFLGSNTCAGCHTREFASWGESQHHKAMQHADDSSVLGNFDDAVILQSFGEVPANLDEL